MKNILFIIVIFFISINGSYAENKEIDYIISPEYSGIEQFYKSNLTNEEIAEIKKIYEQLDNKRIYCKTHGGYSGNGCWSGLRDLLSETYINLKKYIKIENEIKYNQYMLNNSNVTDLGNYEYIIELEKKYKDKEVIKQVLTEKQKNQIIEILKTFDNARIEKLLIKLDNLLKNGKLTEKQKIIISEIKELITETSNDIFIKNILNTEKITLPADFTDL